METPCCNQHISLGARHRQKESVIRRQIEVMKKMEYDKLAAENQTEALRLKVREYERYALNYKQQIEELGFFLRRLEDKHDAEIRAARAELNESLKRITRLTLKEQEQEQVIEKLRAENRDLKGHFNSYTDDGGKKKRFHAIARSTTKSGSKTTNAVHSNGSSVPP
eukprot:gene16983-18695_t